MESSWARTTTGKDKQRTNIVREDTYVENPEEDGPILRGAPEGPIVGDESSLMWEGLEVEEGFHFNILFKSSSQRGKGHVNKWKESTAAAAADEISIAYSKT